MCSLVPLPIMQLICFLTHNQIHEMSISVGGKRTELLVSWAALQLKVLRHQVCFIWRECFMAAVRQCLKDCPWTFMMPQSSRIFVSLFAHYVLRTKLWSKWKILGFRYNRGKSKWQLWLLTIKLEMRYLGFMSILNSWWGHFVVMMMSERVILRVVAWMCVLFSSEIYGMGGSRRGGGGKKAIIRLLQAWSQREWVTSRCNAARFIYSISNYIVP